MPESSAKASSCPFAENERANAGILPNCFNDFPVDTSQVDTSQKETPLLVIAKVFPSGENANERIFPFVPSPKWRVSLPVDRSHNRLMPMPLPAASSFPFGENARQV